MDRQLLSKILTQMKKHLQEGKEIGDMKDKNFHDRYLILNTIIEF